jgi:nitroreductase
LQAGRATGSSQNRQLWRFYVSRARSTLDALSETVYAPANLRGCQAAIAVTTTARSTFDAGRCAQNMALAAWSDGIGSSPNSARDVEGARRILGAGEDETIATILSLGYPARPWTPRADDIDGILQRIKRKPLEELTVWVD